MSAEQRDGRAGLDHGLERWVGGHVVDQLRKRDVDVVRLVAPTAVHVEAVGVEAEELIELLFGIGVRVSKDRVGCIQVASGRQCSWAPVRACTFGAQASDSSCT